MICESCGGRYEDDMLLCPYCGTENPALAAGEQQAYMAQYEEKTRRLDEVPDRLARRASGRAGRTAGIVAGFFLAALLAGWGVSRIAASRALGKQQKQVQQLEEYYQAGEYGRMADYLEEIGGSGATFEKYDQMGGIYERFVWTKNFVEDYQDEIRGCLQEQETDRALNLISCDLSDCFGQLRRIRDLEEEGFPYGNKDGMREIAKRYEELLADTYLLDADEIGEGISRYESAETDYTDLAELALKRLSGGNV